MTRRIAEHDVGGKQQKQEKEQRRPVVVVAQPIAYLLKNVVLGSIGYSIFWTKELQARQMVDDEDERGHDDQHLHRRKTHLLATADILANEITRPQEQLPQRVRHRPRTDAPKLHHALVDATPCHHTRAAALSAAGTEVALELLATVLATMPLVAHFEGDG